MGGGGGGGGGGVGSGSGLYVGMKEVQSYCDYNVDSYTNINVNHPTTTANPTTFVNATTINPTTTINHAAIRHQFVTRGGHVPTASSYSKEAHIGLISLMNVDMLIAAGH